MKAKLSPRERSWRIMVLMLPVYEACGHKFDREKIARGMPSPEQDAHDRERGRRQLAAMPAAERMAHEEYIKRELAKPKPLPARTKQAIQRAKAAMSPEHREELHRLMAEQAAEKAHAETT